MRIYNTLTHKKQEFESIMEKYVGMYTCGPTVYNFAHIGNMRAYIVADLLKRVLIYNGYEVNHAMNITDVGHLVSDANLGEDKMRIGAEREHKTVYEIAEFYTEKFMEDFKRLNLIMPNIIAKATAHVNEMLELIYRLDEKGYLYKVETGMYYDTSKFKNYGQLMNLSFEELNNYLVAGARVERASGIKNTTDFAVWRFSKPDVKDMVWDTKYGKGFPGWHIECSAMSMEYLGEHFDIHTGGVDHLPIHHTNEIAQSESATKKKFVNFWVHNEYLLINGKKISKSLHNFYTLQDLIDKGYSANSYKYLILSSHYKSQANFTMEALENASNTLNGIYSFIKKVSDSKGAKNNILLMEKVNKIKKEFFEFINDDLDTPQALSKMHTLITETNKFPELGKADANAILASLMEFDKILGLNFEEHMKKQEISNEIRELIEKRNKLRNEKKFAESDKIRKKLKEDYNVEIEDNAQGTSWHRL
ncbi:MAG: cysteine--tRNA ligase [Candidatus Micrarchaeaceae archaeon]